MAVINVKVPNLGDSVTSAVLIKWHKQDGESVQADEPICELETDKANVDVPSPAAGVIHRSVKEGETVAIDQVIAGIDPDAQPSTKAPAPAHQTVSASLSSAPTPMTQAEAPGTNKMPLSPPKPEDFPPAVRRLLDEHHLDPALIPATGPGGRLTKEDVVAYLEENQDDQRASDAEPATAAPVLAPAPVGDDGKGIRRVPMSKIRRRIAERLVNAQQTAAILTTFNEIDLKNVIDIRSRLKETFEKVHGVGLGFMSFFARAVVLALKEFPRVNAQIDGNDVVYFDAVHLGIAVSTERGLAVPVLRNAHQMSFAKIESEIKRLAAATRDGKLSLQELSGGTFTITNGGVFGSLLSTPILNPPQSGILGMHKIQERPVVVNGEVVVRPMMYVALSYDHRLIDGRESVSFLVRVKELLEDPARLLLEV